MSNNKNYNIDYIKMIKQSYNLINKKEYVTKMTSHSKSVIFYHQRSHNFD